MTTLLVGVRASLAQTSSALTRVRRDLEEMGTAQVFSWLASLFFAEFIEQSFLFISQLHPGLCGFKWS